MVIGRAVELHMLTHWSITVTLVLSSLVPILLELYYGEDLRKTLDLHMSKMKPPAASGREQQDSYVISRGGPGNIPKHDKWLQHLTVANDKTTKELVHRYLEEPNDKNVAGWGDQPSRLPKACHFEQVRCFLLSFIFLLCCTAAPRTKQKKAATKR